MIDQTFDLVVIGAGPAGMAGALEAAKHKLSVLVLDEQPEEGGQIFRSISTTERLRPEIFAMLGNDYQSGKKLLFSFQQAGVKYLSGATVWLVEADKSVYAERYSTSSSSQALIDCNRSTGTPCTDSRLDSSRSHGSSCGRCVA